MHQLFAQAHALTETLIGAAIEVHRDKGPKIARTLCHGQGLPANPGKRASVVALAGNRSETSSHESQSRQATLRERLRPPNAVQGGVVRPGRVLFTSTAVPGASAPLAPAEGAVSMNLSQHGAASRCLLRLRENTGEPGMSDAAFLARFLPRYPDWRDRPGAADVAMLAELARELQLATTIDVVRSYDQVLQEHRAGRGILVQTERVPAQVEPTPPVGRHVTLLVTMTEAEFSLWCPYPSGNSETLPVAKREWWDRWLAIGFVLGQSQPPH